MLTSSKRGNPFGPSATIASTAHAASPADGRTRQRQQHAFRHELSDDSRTSRTERRAHGHLRLTPSGANEQQIGNVGASDQQHEGDGAEHREQCATHVTGHPLANFFGRAGEVRVAVWKFSLQTVADGLHLSLGGVRRDAGPNAGDCLNEVRAAVARIDHP